jgi:DNA-binding PadR family transcriptional regulator
MSGSGKKSREISCFVPRGFLKTYLLEIMSEGPIHGYALMEKVQKNTGFWKPSPGTIYPLLRSLVKDGFVEIISGSSRRKEYRLTAKGKKLSQDFRKTKHLLNEKLSGVLSCMTPASKKELKAYFRSAANDCKEGLILYPMHRMFSILLKVPKSPYKITKATEIIDEACNKLSKLLETGDGK